MAGGYRIVPVDMLTGARLLPSLNALIDSYSATASITTEGQGDFTLRTRDERHRINLLAWDRICLGWGTGIVLEWVEDIAFSRKAGVICYAGLNIQVVDEWDTGLTRITTKEVSALLALRLLWGIGELGQGHRVLRGNSLQDIKSQVIWWALVRNPPRWGLRIDLPSYATTGNVVRAQYRYNFQPASSVIEQLDTEENAPDHKFTPYWAADGLRWRVEYGRPYFNRLSAVLPVAQTDTVAGDGHSEYRPTNSAVVGLTRTIDYQSQRTGIFTQGTGSEEDMRYGQAGGNDVAGIANNIPYLDSVQSFKNVDARSQLDSLSRQALADARGGVVQHSFGVMCEELPSGRSGIQPGQIQPGTVVELQLPGDNRRWRKTKIRELVLSVTYSSTSPLRLALETQEARS